MAEGDSEDEDWSKPVEGDPGLNSPIRGFDDSTTVTCKKPKGREPMNVDHSRTIVHIDLDCFYAQVEMVRNPALRNKPLGIQQKYLLVTCNYVARSRGVTKLMRVSDALQRCPELVIVSGEDLTHYREMSYRITELLQQFSSQVERLGFDENFIDVTHLVTQRLQGNNQETDFFGHVYGESPSNTGDAVTLPICTCGCHQKLLIGSHIAHEMREALRTRLGLTSCAGTAHNKLLAKLVGSVNKPNDQTTILPHSTGKLMGSLSKVTQIPGIGHSTGKKLSSLGITTLSELIGAPFTLLKDEFGYQTASTMQSLCQGHDETPVIQSGPPQSISDEDSFKKCGTLQQAQDKIQTLLTSLLQRLKKDGRQPHTLRLSVRKYSQVHKWTRESRQCGIPASILHSFLTGVTDEAATTSRLLDLCLSLFHKMVDASRPFHLTLINVCFAKFQSPSSTTSDISKFFLPKSLRKDDEASRGATGDAFAVDESFRSQSDIIPKEERSPVRMGTEKQGQASSTGWHRHWDAMRSTSSSSHQDDGTISICSQPASSHAGNYSASPSQCTANTRGPRDQGRVETVNVQSGPTLRQEDNKEVLRTNVSPQKQLSFFGFKSDSPHTSQSPSNDSQMAWNTERNPKPSSVESTRESSSVNDPCRDVLKINSDCPTETAVTAVPPNIDQSVFAELPTEVQQELLNEWKHSNAELQTNQTAERHESPTVHLPGIDQSVFNELPPDIQEDILRQHKQKKRTLSNSPPHKTLQVKRPKTVKTHSSKNAGKNKNIKDFFTQK